MTLIYTFVAVYVLLGVFVVGDAAVRGHKGKTP